MGYKMSHISNLRLGWFRTSKDSLARFLTKHNAYGVRQSQMKQTLMRNNYPDNTLFDYELQFSILF